MAKVHSKLGASKAERWLNCPGSVALCADLEDVSSPYGREGSAAHEFAERCLTAGFDALDLVGRVHPEYPEFPMTAEMAGAVQVYLDFCRSHFMDAETGARYDWASTLVEHQFALSDIDDELFGTADFCAYWEFESHLHVVDYKHGAGVLVNPRDNCQLMYYALGALPVFEDVAEVTIHVVQPRAGGKAIKSWNAPLGRLAMYADTLREGVEAARQHDAPLRSGTWCQFCPAKAHDVCPRIREKRTEKFAADFENVGELLEGF